MIRAFHHLSLGAVAVVLLTALPLTALAHGNQRTSPCPTPKTHHLPSSADSSTSPVISFGVQGGNLRPWSVRLTLDGSITATGTYAGHQQLTDPKNTLKGLLALADAEGFFSMKKAVGCLGASGNPDTSARFISIHTSSGAKRVREFGSCAATSKYDQLYAVLEEVAGIGG